MIQQFGCYKSYGNKRKEREYLVGEMVVGFFFFGCVYQFLSFSLNVSQKRDEREALECFLTF